MSVYTMNENKYPAFYINNENLVAILKPNRMFHLKRGQHGKGDGFEFRIYITRAMVLKYRGGREISFDEFKKQLSGTFAKYLLEINELLPKGFLENKKQNLL